MTIFSQVQRYFWLHRQNSTLRAASAQVSDAGVGFGMRPRLGQRLQERIAKRFAHSYVLASYPVPRPAFRRCLVLSSDEKLGVGLGTRLPTYMFSRLLDCRSDLFRV